MLTLAQTTPVLSHLVLSLRWVDVTPNYKPVLHLGSVWLEGASLKLRSLAVSHVLNTLRLLGSCCACFVISIVTRWEVLRPCHYSHRRSTWLLTWLPCVEYFALAVDLYPFLSLSSSQRSCDIPGVGSARRLRRRPFPSAAIVCTGETLRPRANHRPFSQPPDANALQRRVAEDNGAPAREKKT